MRSDMNTVIDYAQRYLNGEISYYAFTNQIIIKSNRDNNIICVLDSQGESWLLADPLGKDFMKNEAGAKAAEKRV